MQATTTSDLLRQVRNQIRESNPNGITDQEILDTLNRGQNRAVEVMTRNWIYNYLAQEKITTNVDGTFQIPEQARGNRIVNIEVDRGSGSDQGGTYSLKKLNYKNVSQFKNSNVVNGQPLYYSVQGRTATVYPQVSSEIRITYVRNPEKIVKSAGYIYETVSKTINEETSLVHKSKISDISFVDEEATIRWTEGVSEEYYIAVANQESSIKYIECKLLVGSNSSPSYPTLKFEGIDLNSKLINPEISMDGETYGPLLGSGSLTLDSGIKFITETKEVLDYIVVSGFDNSEITPSDSYLKSSYFNIVDAQTGLIKVSLQAAPTSQIDEVTGHFKLYPMEPYKQKVLNRPITGPTTLEIDDLGFEDDDQICSTYGSSVLELDTILENFVIQYAVTEIRRSLGNQDMVSEVQILSQFEKDIRRANLNRDNSRRIQFKTSTFVKGRYRFNLLR